MKHDMSGAAAVIGALRAAALLELPTPRRRRDRRRREHAERHRLPARATSSPRMSGKTIEVLNTDAEGRVVLADALHYARTTWQPDAIIDLATLTGAMSRRARRLGDRPLRQQREARSSSCAPRATRPASALWPMPLLDAHKEEIRSEIAEIKNTGGRPAGSSTAAAFLGHFVGDTPWVHLDIAGTAWTSKPGPTSARARRASACVC